MVPDLAAHLGDVMVLDDEDERLWLKRNGRFEAEVVPEADEGEAVEGEWKRLSSPDDMVEFYDPTDVFGDLAEAIAEAYPSVSQGGDDDDDADDDMAEDDEA